jgi:hypothetical protein
VERMNKEKGVKLLTVELQNGNRPYVTKADIKLRTNSTLWFKENLINIAVQHLPECWEYMAWIDSDLYFQNKNWVSDTIDQLQMYKIVQLFSHAIDLGPKKETLQVHTSFFYQYVNGEVWKDPKYGTFFHPGFAYGIRRQAYDDIGGLMEFPILGSADHHMALAFIGLVNKNLNSKLHPNYRLLCNIFQKRCERHIKRNVGYVSGTILHEWHGSKILRQYCTRWQILIKNQFDPLEDIKKDSNNLWVLEDEKNQLRDDLIEYFRRRNEDINVRTENCKYTKIEWL